MKLLAEIVGVLAAGAAIAMIPGRFTSSHPRSAVGVAAAVVAVASVLFFENGWSTISPYPAAARADQAIPKAAAETAAGASTNVGFLAWAREKMAASGGRPSFTLVPEAARNDAFTYQWSTYLLLPGFATDDPQRANWIVFYEVNPQMVPDDRSRFTRLTVYSPGFALAEHTRVG
jgi:hypothetical protein